VLNLAAVKLDPFFGRPIFGRVDITFVSFFCDRAVWSSSKSSKSNKRQKESTGSANAFPGPITIGCWKAKDLVANGIGRFQLPLQQRRLIGDCFVE
jgi:hypothetical protein